MIFMDLLYLTFLHCFYLNTASDKVKSIIGDETECETIGGDKCVFPFTYQGRTYFACTADDSDNGAPWCAVQVQADSRRTVLRGKWEDCSPDCPGYDLSGDICILSYYITNHEKNISFRSLQQTFAGNNTLIVLVL